jgi:hypothetical protein
MPSEFFADGFNDDVTGILVALLPEVSVDDDSAAALQFGAEVLLQEGRLAGATTGAEKRPDRAGARSSSRMWVASSWASAVRWKMGTGYFSRSIQRG